MTMPLQFDKPGYLRVLREAGVARDLAEAHADAIEAGLAQPIVLPADLALLKAEILARVDEMLDARLQEFRTEIYAYLDQKLRPLRPLYLMCAVSLALSITSVILNCVILARL